MTTGTLDAGHRRAIGTKRSMICRLLFGLALALVVAPGWAQESLLDVVLKRDKVMVATYSTSPPLAYVDDSGKLVGFEIDMAREIAKDLLGDPEKVEFVVVQSDGRFPAALSGKIDFGLCSTTIFPDRAVRIAFTRPYLDTGGSVIARKDAEIKHVKELNNPKFTYAILNVPPAIARAKQVLPDAKPSCCSTRPRHCSSRSRLGAPKRSRSISRSPISMRPRTRIWSGSTPAARRSPMFRKTRST
jgi:ABC-type amino acid transport substrate-binding protein